MSVDGGGGGGGAGLVELEPPCGSPPSAKTFVEGATVKVRAKARQKPESSSFDFFICFSCLCRDDTAAGLIITLLEQKFLNEENG
jgi:hypothetical protein